MYFQPICLMQTKSFRSAENSSCDNISKFIRCIFISDIAITILGKIERKINVIFNNLHSHYVHYGYARNKLGNIHNNICSS